MGFVSVLLYLTSDFIITFDAYFYYYSIIYAIIAMF